MPLTSENCSNKRKSGKRDIAAGIGFSFSAITLIFLDNILLPSLLMIAREKNRPGKRAGKTKRLLLCVHPVAVGLFRDLTEIRSLVFIRRYIKTGQKGVPFLGQQTAELFVIIYSWFL